MDGFTAFLKRPPLPAEAPPTTTAARSFMDNAG
jgi:hypothetical protein